MVRFVKRAKSLLYLSMTILAGLMLHFADSAWAFNLNDSGTMVFGGKISTKNIMRISDNTEYDAVPIEAGDLVMQRNSVVLELRHDLEQIGNFHVNYNIQGRAYYDTVWDYGPDVFSDEDTRAEYGLYNQDQIDDDKKDVEIFLGYVDVANGPLKLRLGKQALSWGDMSTIRILDGTNPLDQQSVGVDLDERMIPLRMVRGTYNTFGFLGLNSFSIDTYYIPGTIENDNGTDYIDGSPIGAPAFRASAENPYWAYPVQKDEIEDDRFGVNFAFGLPNFNFSLAYYRKYDDNITSDAGTTRLVTAYNEAYGARTAVKYEKQWETVDVVGGKFDTFLSSLDTVLRGEIAYFFDEAYYVSGVTAPTAIGYADDGTALYDEDGEYCRFDVLRFGIGLDKEVPIPLLNSERNFSTTIQWLSTYIQDFDERIVGGGIDVDTLETVYAREWTNQIVGSISSSWMGGFVSPSLTVICGVEAKALLLMPVLGFDLGHNQSLSFNLRYVVADSYEGVGCYQEANYVGLDYEWTF